MRFTNPWIDPRVQFVQSKDAQAYLLRHGWKPVPFPRTDTLMFAGPLADSGKPITQIVPISEDSDAYVQRIIELITALAILEDRTAVAVLDDILQQAAVNGPPASDGNDASQAPKGKRRQRKR
jgi:hypothetical protein